MRELSFHIESAVAKPPHNREESAVKPPNQTRPGKLPVMAALMPILLYYCSNGYPIPTTTGHSLAEHVGRTNPLLDQGPAVAVVLGACCMALFNSRVIVTRLKQVPYLVYSVLLAVMSGIWSSDRIHSAEFSVMLVSLLIIAAYCCGRLRDDDLLRLLTYAGAVAFVLSILLVVLAPDLGLDPGQAGAWRGVFGQKNNCGAYAGLFIFSALNYKAIRLVDRRARLLCLILGPVIVLMSQSRTGWLLLGVGVAVTVMVRTLKRFGTRDAFTLSLVLFTTMAIALGFLYTHRGTALLILGKDPTINQRTIIWSLVWEAVLAHPIFGYGFNSFWQGLRGESANVILVTRWAQGQAQNGYLDLWLQLGICGVILVALGLLKAVNDLRRQWTRRSSRQLAWCTTVIVTTLLYNLGESSLLAPRNISWFFFVVACMSASANSGPDTSIPSVGTIPEGRAWRGPLPQSVATKPAH